MKQKRRKNKKYKKQEGFSLIELLLVISIISLLASIVITSSSIARRKAHDFTIVSNLTQLAKASELYFGDTGYYPFSPTMEENCASIGNSITGMYCIIGQQGGGGPGPQEAAVNIDELGRLLKPYMIKLPNQLSGDGNSFRYLSALVTGDNFPPGAGYLRDTVANICYSLQPNGYFYWGYLNFESSQINLTGVNSQEIVLASPTIPKIPCP